MKAAYVVVDVNGNPMPGEVSGISSTSKPGTGTYLINYEDNFMPAPGVSATPCGSGSLCSVNIMAENMCEVFVTDLQGKPMDGAFAFLAIGK